jgi:hypothetical protein
VDNTFLQGRRVKGHFRRNSTGRAHCLEEFSSFGGGEMRSESNLFSEVFARPRAPFLTHLWWISLAYQFVIVDDYNCVIHPPGHRPKREPLSWCVVSI